MDSANLAEVVASEFLVSHGFTVARFTKDEMQASKTPDFRIFKQGELVCYCEAKHIERDTWLEDQWRQAVPGQVIVGGERPDPIYNRLTSHIHNAYKQFQAVNPLHACFNVLVMVNSDRLCNVKDLFAVLEGNFYAGDGHVDPIYTRYSEGRIRREKCDIDLYVWCEYWHPKQLIHRYYTLSPEWQRLCSLFGTDPQSVRRLPQSTRRWG